ncbi:hypothetical protein L218DRAFT_888001 [Marasmius fiardii PR-910]|nr:hypothetical protein L218DRAFT_888001 [Marasmius fiardii PR-910]
MSTALSLRPEYRPRVASPRVVKASRKRRREGINLLPCEKCGATFTSYHNLKYESDRYWVLVYYPHLETFLDHRNAHHKIKLFPCDYCYKSFAASQNRNRHCKICPLNRLHFPMLNLRS